MGGSAPTVNRRRAVAGATLLTSLSCFLVWALAHPDVALGAATVRAIAGGAAIVALGLAVVPLLDTGRHRAELRRGAAGPLVVTAAVWLGAELVRMVTQSAAAAGTGVWTLGWRTAYEFTTSTAPGRVTLLTITAAALVVAVAALAPPSPATTVITIGAAALGLLGRPLSGHLAHDAVGSLAVAAHILAAALWCGALAAVVLTVAHRGRWSRVLPRFSQMSLWCVLMLLIAGTVAGFVELDSPGALLHTGYGRILTVKVVCTGVLLVLAWRHRTVWVPAARGHRSPAQLSRRRALTELAVMCVALAAAAALAIAG